jgi:hypothetical protein
MDKTIARLNIQHYRDLLANEKDEAKLRTIRRLLDEEKEKLEALDALPAAGTMKPQGK